MNGDVIKTIVNSIIFVIMVCGTLYLIIGAFLNARREAKGEPKKKRTSMVIWTCAIMVICYMVFYALNPIPQ
jgi:hypothetical protein